MTRAPEVAFVGALVHAHPLLFDLLQEHLDTYDQLIPHIFMGELENWVEERFRSHGASDAELVSIFGFLEDSYGDGNPYVDELIFVSFLETLPTPDDQLAEIRALAGPKLTEQLHLIG